jgi:hypothetical protein
MSNLIIEGTKNTPAVIFDSTNRIYSISGISTPMNAMEFYSPLMEWIKSNKESIGTNATFTIDLPYYNSASMKTLLMTLQEIKAGRDEGCEWGINWIVEDEDEFMQEGGESFQELLEFEFNIIPK